MTDDGLFVPDGDRFLSSELTRGGWSDHAQHGGPPVGLLAHVIEHRHSSAEMMVTRLTTDLVRPVPVAPLTVESRVVRPGKRIQVIEAILHADDVEVALATALMIRIASIDLPERPVSGWEQPPGPEESSPVDTSAWTGFMAPMPRFHVNGVEIRTQDRSFYTAGLGNSWFRLRHPVVVGTTTSPFVRAATLADFGNGNSTAVDPREWLYVNPDVDLSLHRPLDGEWLGMRSFAFQHNTGIGLAQSLIFDTSGPIGTVTQSQLIEPHRPS